MKVKCPDCGHEHELGSMLLPVCPRCVLDESKHPLGMKDKHATEKGARDALASAIAKGKGDRPISFLIPGINPQAIVDYMASGIVTPGGAISGCQLYWNKPNDSINAVSYYPLAQIPGSGITQSSEFAAHFAILCDLEGKSGDRPHLFFESQDRMKKSIDGGLNILCPLCPRCGIAPWRLGGICPYCART